MSKTNKIEINPFTGENLNPDIEVVDYDGKITKVVYTEDYMKKTGKYDFHVGAGVKRLTEKLTPEEWKAVSKWFKRYNEKWFTWGTAKHDIVIKTIVKMRNPHVERVVVRNKMTAEGVRKMKENGMNMHDGVTGEWLFPKE